MAVLSPPSFFFLPPSVQFLDVGLTREHTHSICCDFEVVGSRKSSKTDGRGGVVGEMRA